MRVLATDAVMLAIAVESANAGALLRSGDDGEGFSLSSILLKSNASADPTFSKYESWNLSPFFDN